MSYRKFIAASVSGAMLFALGCGESTTSSSESVEQDAPAKSEFQLTEAQEDARYEQAKTWFDSQESVVAPWVKMVGAKDLEGAKVEADRLIFANPPESMNEVVPGDILVSANPDQGQVFLRRVMSVNKSGGLQIVTENAGVNQVVMKGSITKAPTQAMPERFREAGQVVPQQFGSPELAARVARWFGDLQNFNDANDSRWSVNFELVTEGPYYQSRDPESDVNARFNKSWFSNPRTTVTVPGGFRARTSCDEVTEALDYIQESGADVAACRRAYAAWTDAGANTITNSMVSSQYVRRVTGSRGEPRMQCTDDGVLWNTYYSMPYAEEVKWAQTNCGGVLEEADIRISYGTDIGLQDFGMKASVAYGGDLTNQEFNNTREELTEYTKNFVLWAGWLPVVFQFNGKFLSMGITGSAQGEVSAGVKNLNFGMGHEFRLRYNGGELTSQGSWTVTNSPTRSISGDPYLSGELSGTLELSVNVVDVDLLIYGVAGPYLAPLTLYGRADAGVQGQTGGGVDICPLGMSAGIKSSFGIRGAIPFTNINKSWQLWKNDTCGSDSRVSRSFYERTNNFCQKKCLIGDPEEGPLKVSITWDERVDIDIDIDLPEGEGANINFRRPTFGSLELNNVRGCKIGSCRPSGPYTEKFEWTAEQPAPSGDYVVRAYNQSDEPAQVTVVVVGEGQDGSPRTVTVPANSSSSVFLKRFSID